MGFIFLLLPSLSFVAYFVIFVVGTAWGLGVGMFSLGEIFHFLFISSSIFLLVISSLRIMPLVSIGQMGLAVRELERRMVWVWYDMIY
tara:strand:- start:139 stop:402 length:264 start_codon:yes stop_codon:yes gene_type:complete